MGFPTEAQGGPGVASCPHQSRGQHDRCFRPPRAGHRLWALRRGGSRHDLTPLGEARRGPKRLPAAPKLLFPKVLCAGPPICSHKPLIITIWFRTMPGAASPGGPPRTSTFQTRSAGTLPTSQEAVSLPSYGRRTESPAGESSGPETRCSRGQAKTRMRVLKHQTRSPNESPACSGGLRGNCSARLARHAESQMHIRAG